MSTLYERVEEYFWIPLRVGELIYLALVEGDEAAGLPRFFEAIAEGATFESLPDVLKDWLLQRDEARQTAEWLRETAHNLRPLYVYPCGSVGALMLLAINKLGQDAAPLRQAIGDQLEKLLRGYHRVATMCTRPSSPGARSNWTIPSCRPTVRTAWMPGRHSWRSAAARTL
jgi:hypothetical protein